MSRRKRSPSLVVVGGGILGSIVGHLAAIAGFETVVYRVGDALRPEADSLRNHGWLQSGLLYAGDRHEVAARMRWSGRRMLRKYGLAPPTARGIFRVANEAAADALLADARSIRLQGQVERLSESENRRILGPFHLPGRPCFSVPDAPFNQAQLLQEVRREGAKDGARYRDVKEPVSLKPVGTGRFILCTPDGELQPDATVVAAGCATSSLLLPLGIRAPLAVYRSPLLNMRADALLQETPLFVDRSTALSAVRHESTSWGGNVLVVGDRTRSLMPPAEPMIRKITRAEEESLLLLLPPDIRPTRDVCRGTAGFKTEGFNDDGESSIEPWIFAPPEWPSLLAAVPGKATMSLATAEAVIRRVTTLEPGLPLPTLDSSWHDPVRMHFDYPDLDERSL